MRLGFVGRSDTASEVVPRPQGSVRHTTPQHGGNNDFNNFELSELLDILILYLEILGVAGVTEFPSLRTPNSPHLMNTQLNSSRNNLSHLHHVEASPSRMGHPQNQQHVAHHIGTGKPISYLNFYFIFFNFLSLIQALAVSFHGKVAKYRCH